MVIQFGGCRNTLKGIKEKVRTLLSAGLRCFADQIGACALPYPALSRIAWKSG